MVIIYKAIIVPARHRCCGVRCRFLWCLDAVVLGWNEARPSHSSTEACILVDDCKPNTLAKLPLLGTMFSVKSRRV